LSPQNDAFCSDDTGSDIYTLRHRWEAQACMIYQP